MQRLVNLIYIDIAGLEDLNLVYWGGGGGGGGGERMLILSIKLV